MVMIILGMLLAITSSLVAAAPTPHHFPTTYEMDSFEDGKRFLDFDPITTLIVVDIDHTLLAYENDLLNTPWQHKLYATLCDQWGSTDAHKKEFEDLLFLKRKPTEPAAINFINSARGKGFTVVALSSACESVESNYFNVLKHFGCGLPRSHILCRKQAMREKNMLKGPFFLDCLDSSVAEPVLVLPNNERISFKHLVFIDDCEAQHQSFEHWREEFKRRNIQSMHLVRYTRYWNPENLHPIFTNRKKGQEGWYHAEAQCDNIFRTLVQYRRTNGAWPNANQLMGTMEGIISIRPPDLSWHILEPKEPFEDASPELEYPFVLPPDFVLPPKITHLVRVTDGSDEYRTPTPPDRNELDADCCQPTTPDDLDFPFASLLEDAIDRYRTPSPRRRGESGDSHTSIDSNGTQGTPT